MQPVLPFGYQVVMPGGPLGRGGNAIWFGKEEKSHNKKEKAEAGCGQTNTTRAAVEVLQEND